MARIILICIMCIQSINHLHGQDSADTIQQIVLDLKDPSTIILNPGHHRSYQNKFEIHSKSPVVFKIKNINPLRHDYYLNDEIVTNFFDATSITQPNNIYVNGINPVKEIPAINIFNFDVVVPADIEQQIQIRDLKKEIELLRKNYNEILDSIEIYSKIISSLPGYSEYYNNDEQKISQSGRNKIKTYLSKYDLLYAKLVRAEKYYSSKLNELLNLYNKISDKDISILVNRDSFINKYMNQSLSVLIQKCRVKSSELQQKLKTLDDIINLVQELELPSAKSEFRFRISQEVSINTRIKITLLKDLLKSEKYIDNSFLKLLSNPDYLNNAEWVESKFQIIEFVLNRKNRFIEECILFNSLEVGKLLESNWIEYSREKNKLLNMPSIDQADIDTIKFQRDTATCFFNYVKAWIADFALLNQSVKLDNKIFKEVHTNITSNCNKLLLFIRDLDHLVKPNITEYTFPIFHNNKNVDLIRFKIDKKDKFSNAQQTYVYDMWIKGGLKIDFSVGFLATGLVDQQFNSLPFYTTNTEEAYKDTFFIARANPGRYSFCFGGMVNISRRNGSSWINIGGSLGLGYSTNQKLQALAGLSFHLGKTERIILHAGFSFGSIKHLDLSKISVLQSGTIPMKEHSILVKGDINNFAIPEIERFSAKPFFGISYNLSRQHSFQAVKSQPGFQYYNSERQ